MHFQSSSNLHKWCAHETTLTQEMVKIHKPLGIALKFFTCCSFHTASLYNLQVCFHCKVYQSIACFRNKFQFNWICIISMNITPKLRRSINLILYTRWTHAQIYMWLTVTKVCTKIYSNATSLRKNIKKHQSVFSVPGTRKPCLADSVNIKDFFAIEFVDNMLIWSLKVVELVHCAMYLTFRHHRLSYPWRLYSHTIFSGNFQKGSIYLYFNWQFPWISS